MRKVILCLMAFSCIGAIATAYTPGAPSQLNLSPQATVVTLTWNWENTAAQTSLENFESEEFPPADWVLDSTNEEPECTWIPYTFGEGEDFTLSHSGTGVTLIMTGYSDYENPLSEYHQDESLLVKPKAGSVYMDFWYYIHPMLLEDGAYSDFPDHYYVEVSYDNGDSWSELWDARWDMGPEDEVRQASLFLDQPADDNTLVRFRAVSGEFEGLYYLWAIDDVAFYSQLDKSDAPSVKAERLRTERVAAAVKGLRTHREFTPSHKGEAAKINRNKIVDELVNNGHITWRVCRDGEPLFSYVKAFKYVDSEAKDGGDYTYSVMPWSEKDNYAYEAAEETVNVTPPDFSVPLNVKAVAEKADNGRYDISVTWEDPQDELIPSSYTVMINGKHYGEMPYGDVYEMGQNVYHGIYWFDVIANYSMPDGSSEPVVVKVAAGVQAAPDHLEAEVDGNDVILTWDVPDYGAETPEAYDVYRGDELLASAQTATTYRDVNVADGTYCYSIHAVYGKERSLPAEADVKIGENYKAELPIEESFNNGHLPANWNVYIEDSRNVVKEMYSWRFDNYFDITWPWNNDYFNYNNASVSGVAAGMNNLLTYLCSPAFVPSSDSQVIFKNYYDDPTGKSNFTVRVRNCDDDATETIAYLTTTSGLETVTLPLGDYEGKTICLEWGFASRNSGIAMVDDVKITGTAGVEGIVSSTDSSVEVYNIQGIRIATGKDMDSTVNNLPSGIYLIKCGGTVTKKIVK